MLSFPNKERYGWEDLLEMMSLLRTPDGCPWDRVQTHASIRRNFLEETYEALDAIDRDDPEAMKEELGDVLLQVVFHAQMEAERGRFTMDDVVDALTRKLLRRHPHVFGGEEEAPDADAAVSTWEARKRAEQGQDSTADAIEAVPHTLPALWRAEKIQKKVTKAGFTWGSALSAMEKLEQEAAELREALETGRTGDVPHGIREETGDVLFMASNLAQMEGVDPEEALHLACDKFQRRFRLVEGLADRPLSAYSEAELTALWAAAKGELPE